MLIKVTTDERNLLKSKNTHLNTSNDNLALTWTVITGVELLEAEC